MLSIVHLGALELSETVAILKVAINQVVQIPDLETESGNDFIGRVKANEGEMIVIEHDPQTKLAPSGHRAERLLTMIWRTEGGERTCPILLRQVREGEIACQMVIDERRQSVRARCDLEMYFTVLDPVHVGEVIDSVMARVNADNEPEKFLEHLLRVEIEDDALRTELNTIRGMIERLTLQVERLAQAVEERSGRTTSKELQALDVNDCSATGLSFRHDAQLMIGTMLKVRLVFNSVPKMMFDCVGVIVRSESRAGQSRYPEQFDMGIRFTHIHEADREAIVRHIFKVQRNLLRDRRLSAR